MPAGWQDAWTAAGHASDDEAGHTSGQAPDLANVDSLLRQRIDYVFVRDAAVTACARVGADPEDRVEGRWPSDHAGVVAEVRLAPAAEQRRKLVRRAGSASRRVAARSG